MSILVRYKAFILCIYNLENVHDQLIPLQVSCLLFSVLMELYIILCRQD